MDTTVILSSGEAIDAAVVKLTNLLGELDEVDVSKDKISGDKGSMADKLLVSEDEVNLIKKSMTNLVNGTIEFLNNWKDLLESADEFAANNIDGIDGE